MVISGPLLGNEGLSAADAVQAVQQQQDALRLLQLTAAPSPATDYGYGEPDRMAAYAAYSPTPSPQPIVRNYDNLNLSNGDNLNYGAVAPISYLSERDADLYS